MTDLQQLPKRTVNVPWVVLESTDEGMSLVIQLLLAERGVSKARVSVRESNQRIAVTVEQDVLLADGADLRGTQIALTPMRRTPIQTIRLKAPIAGRRIEGEGMSETPINSFFYLAITDPDRLQIPAVPSVTGLAPEDAVRVLSQHGFVAVLDGHGREIVDQHPRRGERARNRQAAVYDTGEPVKLHAA